MRSLLAKRRALVVGLGAVVAAASFLLDCLLHVGYQHASWIPVIQFDFSSIYYSALQYARGFPLLKYDFTLWGEGAHLWHSLFIRLLGESALSVKYAIATTGAFFCATAFAVIWRLTRRFALATGAGILLWGSLTGFAFDFGTGYAAYYVFAIGAIVLLLGTFYFEGARPKAGARALPFSMGALCGLAYGFKYELASVLLTSYVLAFVWDELRFGEGSPTSGIPFKNVWTALVSAGILGVSAFAYSKGFFFAAALPLLYVLALLSGLTERELKLSARTLATVGWLLLGFIALAGAWIAHLAASTDLRFALEQYLPFHRIDDQIKMMAAHGAYYDDLWERFSTFFEFVPTGSDTFLYLAFVAACAAAAFWAARKFPASPKRPALTLGVMALVALAAQSFLALAPIELRQLLFAAPLVHAGFLVLSKPFREDRIVNWLCIVSAAALWIYLRESNCKVYDTWGVALPAVALNAYAALRYVLPGEQALALSAPSRRTGVYIAGYLVLTQAVLFALASNFVWQIDHAPRMLEHEYHYSSPVGVKLDGGMDVYIQELQTFFKSHLQPNETIFVFAGLRLPYILADRNTGTALRMPYFVVPDAAAEEQILTYLGREAARIPFVVDHVSDEAQFTGPLIREAYPKLARYLDNHYLEERRIGDFRILIRAERKH